MNMNIIIKKLALLMVLCCICLVAEGQAYSTRSKKAIKLYETARWTNSPAKKKELLRKAIKRADEFTEAYVLLARTYAQQDSMAEAIDVLKPVCVQGEPYYSELLMQIGNYHYLSGEYEEALNCVRGITDMRFYDEKNESIALYEKALEMKRNPIPFDPVNLEAVNTEYNDYFPSITADGEMLSTTVLVPPKNGYNTQEDIFVSRKSENGEWSKSEPMSTAINTMNNEGAQTFSADGRYMFFVSCSNNSNYTGSCDIYYSIRQGNRWSRPINLGHPANSEYWESNPVMSASGDKIYFTSNRPGGEGGRDLWVTDVVILNNGILQCSKPKPLGRPINTEHEEWAPYIHSDGETLYFSSNGHGGLGRNDIFVSRNIKGKWTFPMNMGYPINTHGDESGLTVSGDGTKAYFASDKLDSTDNLDIYEIKLAEACRPKSMSSKIGIVVDEETFRPIQAKVEIYDLSTNKRFFESVSDKADGTFSVSLPAKGTFGLSVKKDKYLYYGERIEEDMDTIRVMLKQIKEGQAFDLENIYFAYDSDSLLNESSVEIRRLAIFMKTNSYVRIKIVGHTDNQGGKAYNIDLSKRRALSMLNELVSKYGIKRERMEYDGMGDTKPKATNETEEGRAKNRRVEVVIVR